MPAALSPAATEVPAAWRVERLALAVLLVASFVALVLPGVAGVWGLWEALVVRPLAPAGVFSALAGLGAVALFVGAARAALRWRASERGFVIGAVATAVGAKLGYVALVDVAAVSDFRDMWAIASIAAEHGLEAARPAVAGDYYLQVFLQRASVYLVPLRWAFGPESSSYTVPNVLSGAVTSLLVYRIARGWFPPAAARAALVLSLLAPETFLAAQIPSHDVSTALYIVAAVALAVGGWRLAERGRGRLALLAAAGAGVCFLLVEVQRWIGGFLAALVALFAALVLWPRRRSPVAMALVALPLVVVAAGREGFRRTGLLPPAEREDQFMAMWVASATDPWGRGDAGHNLDGYWHRYRAIDVDWSRETARKIATIAVRAPGDLAALYWTKSKRLFDLGSQVDFYLAAPGGPERSLLPGAALARAFSRWWSLLFLAALIAAVIDLWRHPPAAAALVPLAVLVGIAGGLLCVGLVQPRYLYPVWYLGAIYLGGWMARGGGAPASAARMRSGSTTK